MSELVITRVVAIEELPLGSRATRRLIVAWSDGTQSEALAWFSDEWLFCEGDLVGLTCDEVRALAHRRDRQWLGDDPLGAGKGTDAENFLFGGTGNYPCSMPHLVISAKAPDRLIDALGALAAERGMSRNALIRAALEAAVDGRIEFLTEARIRARKIRATVDRDAAALAAALPDTRGRADPCDPGSG